MVINPSDPGLRSRRFQFNTSVHVYQAYLRYTAAMGTADGQPCQQQRRHLVSEGKLLTCWSMSTNPERVKLCALPNLGDVSHWKSAWLSAPRRRLRCGHNKHKPAPFAPRSCSNGHPSRRPRSHPKPRLSSNSVRLAKTVHTYQKTGGTTFSVQKQHNYCTY